MEIQKAWLLRSCCLRQTLESRIQRKAVSGKASVCPVWNLGENEAQRPGNLPSCLLGQNSATPGFAETQEGDGEDQGVSAFTKSGLGQKEEGWDTPPRIHFASVMIRTKRALPFGTRTGWLVSSALMVWPPYLVMINGGAEA